jgi:hypothetical protein
MFKNLAWVILILFNYALISFQKPIDDSGANTRQFFPFFGLPPLQIPLPLPPRPPPPLPPLPPLPFEIFGQFNPIIPLNQNHVELLPNPIEGVPFFPWFPFSPQFTPYILPPISGAVPVKPADSKPPAQEQQQQQPQQYQPQLFQPQQFQPQQYQPQLFQPQQFQPQQYQPQQVQPQQFLPPMFYMPSVPILESSINNGTHFIYSNNTGTFVSPLSAYDFLNQLPI